jgi:hypothetical protein
MHQILDGPDAWRRLIGSEHSRLSYKADAFGHAPVPIRHEPKFRLTADDRFFCIGSCFARNVEEHLIYRGIDVLSRSILSPKAESVARHNGHVNKFTTLSMLNEIAWQLDPPDIDADDFERQKDAGWVDLQLVPGVPPVPLQRAIDRRRYLVTDYFSRVRKASVVVVTLGLNEVWKDNKKDRYLNAAPSYVAVRREPDRFQLHITDVAENVEALEALRRSLLALNGGLSIIVSVSPVPLADSFSGHDMLVANSLSKSVLLAAARTLSDRHDDTDYYPSFEMVSLAPHARAFAADQKHVADSVVKGVIARFLDLYMGLPDEEIAFRELAYLAANPDVDAAVRLCQFSSGFDHWTKHGRAAGRPLSPADGPTAAMIGVGVVN